MEAEGRNTVRRRRESHKDASRGEGRRRRRGGEEGEQEGSNKVELVAWSTWRRSSYPPDAATQASHPPFPLSLPSSLTLITLLPSYPPTLHSPTKAFLLLPLLPFPLPSLFRHPTHTVSFSKSFPPSETLLPFLPSFFFPSFSPCLLSPFLPYLPLPFPPSFPFSPYHTKVLPILPMSSLLTLLSLPKPILLPSLPPSLPYFLPAFLSPYHNYTCSLRPQYRGALVVTASSLSIITWTRDSNNSSLVTWRGFGVLLFIRCMCKVEV